MHIFYYCYYFLKENFKTYFTTTNTAGKMLRASEIIMILKSVIKNNQNIIPPDLIIPIIKMEDDPTFYFNTYMMLKEIFFSNNVSFDKLAAKCYNRTLTREASTQSRWIILLAILYKSSNE